MNVDVAARLTDAYRIAQAAAAGQTSAALGIAFNTLYDPSNVETFARYEAVARKLIAAGRAQAAGSAGAYYMTQRAALDVAGDVAVAYAADLPAAQVSTSLFVTGPVKVRQSLASGQSIAQAMRSAMSATMGAGYRHAADGGRSTLFGTIAGDPQALGYQRVTDGKPCAFCAMLAGRGAIYKSEAAAGDGRKFHDKCGCTVQPVYYPTQPLPAGSKDYASMWADSGARTLSEFRSYYSGL